MWFLLPVFESEFRWCFTLCLFMIHHICIDSLVPSVKKINIGNPGFNVNYRGPLILLVT